jgi:hypothetical protein
MLSRLFSLIALAVLLASTSASQERKGDRIGDSCGPDDIHFEAHASKHQSDTMADSGKVRLYVIQIIRTPFYMPESPTIRVGVDGRWIGATRGNSYVSASLDAGEHHLCVQWQSSLKSRSGKRAFASFNGQPGALYFRSLFIKRGHILKLERVDPNEGRGLLLSSPASISRHN